MLIVLELNRVTFSCPGRGSKTCPGVTKRCPDRGTKNCPARGTKRCPGVTKTCPILGTKHAPGSQKHAPLGAQKGAPISIHEIQYYIKNFAIIRLTKTLEIFVVEINKNYF